VSIGEERRDAAGTSGRAPGGRPATAPAASIALDELLATVAAQARETIGAHAAAAALVGEAGETTLASLSVSERYASWGDAGGLAGAAGLAERVRRERRVLRLGPDEVDATPPLRGYLAAPLLDRDGGFVGLIELTDRVEGDFDARDEVVLEQLARLASAAIESARLNRDLRRHADELDAIFSLAGAVASAATLDEVFDAALDALERALAVTRGSVVLFDAAGAIHFSAWRGLSDSYRSSIEGSTPWKGHASDTEPLLVGDVLLDDEVADLHDAFRREGIRSMLLVPLVHAGSILGRFVLYADRPDAFSGEDVRLGVAMASHVAGAVDRRRTEDEMRTSRNQLEAIVQSSSDGITVQGADGGLVFANDAAAQLTGFDTAEELLATPPERILERFELLADDGVTPLPWDELPGRRAAATGREVERLICYRIAATGDRRWSLVRATPVTRADGSVERVINLFHEITESRLAEERLRFLGEASRVLASSLDVEATLGEVARLAVPVVADYCLIDVLDEEGRLGRVIIRHTDEEGRRVLEELRDRFPPTFNERHPASRAVATGEPVLIEAVTDDVLVDASMEPEHFALYQQLEPSSYLVVPLVARGRVLGAVSLGMSARSGRHYGPDDIGLARELADRAAVALDNAMLFAASRQALAQLETVLVSAPVGIGFWDTDLRFVRVNDALAQINGVPLEHHVGRTLREVLPGLGAELEPLYRSVLATGTPLVHQEATGTDANSPGGERHWLSSYFPVRTADDETIGVGAVILEITERERAQARLRFLARASEILASSLVVEDVVPAIADLAVSAFCDWCAVWSLEGEELVRIGQSSSSAEQGAAFAANDRYHVERDARLPVVQVARTGEALHLPVVADDELRRLATDDADAERLLTYANRSVMILPLVVRGRTRGVLTLGSRAPGRHDEDDFEAAAELARRLAVELDQADLHREATESLALLDALFSTAPAGLAFLDAGLRFERVNGALADLSGLSAEEHVGRRIDELPPPVYRQVGPEARRVLETGDPVRTEVAGETSAGPGGLGHWLVDLYPVVTVQGRTLGIGVVVLEITERKRAEDRERFLADASTLLAASLDVDTTLQSIAGLAVPRIADWCSISLREQDGSIRTVAVAHKDPAKIAWARELQERYPTDPDAPQGAPAVIRSGVPELVPDIPDELLVEALRDTPELLEPLRELGLRSSLIVPLVARDRVIGALSLVTSRESGRLLGEEDLALAFEVAGRAAVAVENARLFAHTEFQRTLLESQGEASLDGLLVVAPDGRILSANRRFAEIWGIPDEVLAEGQDAAALAVATTKVADPERFVTRVRELYEGRQTSREKLPLRDGRTLERFGAPVRGPDGSDHGYLWSFRDVTEEVRAGERVAFLGGASELLAESLDLQETLTRLAGLAFPALADFCVFDVLDANGEIRQVAAAHRSPERRDFGEAMARVVASLDRPGHPAAAAIRTGTTQLTTEIDEAWLAGMAADEENAAFVRSLGITSYLAVPLLLGKRPIGAVTFAFSDSGRTHTPAEVSLAEELARRAAMAIENARLYAETGARAQAAQALEFVGDGVFLVGSDDVIRLWNPAAERITGLSAASLVGRRASEALEAWPLGHVGERQHTYPVDVEGRELWLALTAVPFDDGTVYAFRDLTDEQAVERLKTDFVSTVSHELRTPLAAIYGAAMTLQRTDVALADEQRTGLLSVVSSESERLARIVNDVLWASRLDAGVLDVSIERCDGGALAGAVVAAARAHLPAGIELALEVSPEAPPVAADPDKVRQVLVNLVDNAIKYSPDGGLVEVRVEPAGGSVRFVVSDRGLGIPPSEHGRIFEKFFRLDPNLTRGVGGTGLGLYICRELVRRMDGRIWVDSAEGAGSVFTFELPVA
jgi:PAS domain S-box-containing protein